MEKRFNMIHALESLTPGAIWSFEEETYDALQWHDETIPKPTESEIADEIVRLQLAADAEEAAMIQVELDKQLAIESATAKLAKFGLTADEIQAVIGIK